MPALTPRELLCTLQAQLPPQLAPSLAPPIRLTFACLCPPWALPPAVTWHGVQDMLARTQALEDHLLALNAEKNELEAESARMPSHTTGRTLQVGTALWLKAARPECWFTGRQPVLASF